MGTEKSIFDQNWGKTDDEFNAEEKPIRENELKRQFEQSYDKIRDEIIKLKKSQKSMLTKNLEGFQINSWRKNKQDIKDHEVALDDIKEEYKNFFGEDLRR